MSALSWSPQQDKALAEVALWLCGGAQRQVFRLFGYAGTGKTTLAKHFAEGVDGPVQFAAFTGKAASVMRRKGCDGASTIHSLIYKPEEVDGETVWRINHDSPIAEADLVIIDLLNGTLWTVDAKPTRRADMIKLKVVPEEDGQPAHVKVNQAFFAGTEDNLDRLERRKSQEMTFGYALTVHKSQGSQWDHVVLFDESGVFREDARRHLYTGLTRAAERLTIVRAA